MNNPNINVTPLIDVLLVLLIIFMVVAPLKPSGFTARIPSEPMYHRQAEPNPQTLAVIVDEGLTLRLNRETGMGTCSDPTNLIRRLTDVFEERKASGDVSELSALSDNDAERPDLVERTVFIRAPRSIGYGDVVKVVDAVKLAGAYPISLQIDNLD
jgi:biopolymer transport protein ExbD